MGRKQATLLAGLFVWAGIAGSSWGAAEDGGTQPVPPNLPQQELGAGDLLSIFIYDVPDLSRTVRIGDDGKIRVPMLREPIQASASLPSQVEERIRVALREQGLLPDPVVSVTVAEYRSRPVRVLGAVKNPTTLQALGKVTLADALATAGGLSPEAGHEVVLVKSDGSRQHIPVSALLNASSNAATTELHGGEEILVPQGGKIYVAGDVEKPGMYLLNESENITVMEALAQSGGLARFAAKDAYIYRAEAGKSARTEIAVPIAKILERKADDVTLLAGDVFYVPDNKNRRLTMTALERVLQFGSTAGATAAAYSAYPGH